MLGPVVNAVAILVCGLAGYWFIQGIPGRFEDIIKKSMGIFLIYIGVKGALENQNVLLLVVSIALGAAIGEAIDIDKWMNRVGYWAEKKLRIKGGTFAKGLVSSSILFCTGSMAIVGSIQSGLLDNHETLFAKSVMDGIFSLIFAGSMGIGVIFSAVPVLIYQAGIALAAILIRDFLSPGIIMEISAVGSLLISAIGFNFLGATEIKVANLIPAVFIPGIYLSAMKLFTP
ncbi:MAG: DUF554 domain-containing protein [Treponema sp.]|jgi:uncharacterized membrane protein YqgA involved in biofilm formation|nr:DUF554 domain-containing protein [Treponema sp.]